MTDAAIAWELCRDLESCLGVRGAAAMTDGTVGRLLVAALGKAREGGRREAVLEAQAPRDGRCPKHPGGERCALPAGHEGGCKWESGD